MSTERILLWGCIILLPTLLFFASYFFSGTSEAVPEHTAKATSVPATTVPRRSPSAPLRRSPVRARDTAVALESVPAAGWDLGPAVPSTRTLGSINGQSGERIAGTHSQRIRERVEELKQESIEKTFVRLREQEGYSIQEPLLSGGALYPRDDVKVMFSNRGFLKVFQEVRALPREEALDKISELWEIAVEKREADLDAWLLFLASQTDPTKHEEYLKLRSSQEERGTARSAFIYYMPMLLAASFGEVDLLVSQLDDMQRLGDMSEKRRVESGLVLPPPDPMQTSSLLEEYIVFTILMYAAQQAGIDVSEAEIPWDAINEHSIPLFRWDAEWTTFDLPVYMGWVKIDRSRADEQFTMYGIKRSILSAANQEPKDVVNTLKEFLSK